jgi:hypothetical protein
MRFVVEGVMARSVDGIVDQVLRQFYDFYVFSLRSTRSLITPQKRGSIQDDRKLFYGNPAYQVHCLARFCNTPVF